MPPFAYHQTALNHLTNKIVNGVKLVFIPVTILFVSRVRMIDCSYITQFVKRLICPSLTSKQSASGNFRTHFLPFLQTGSRAR